MTQHEYQEMLRAALEQLSENCYPPSDMDGISHEYYDNAQIQAHLALATPPPTAKLRPMSEAPKRLRNDGNPTPIIMYFSKWSPAVAWWNDMIHAWSVDCQFEGRSFPIKDEPIGWLPLPEVSE